MAHYEYIDKAEIKTLSQRSNLWGTYLVFHVWAVILASGAIAVIWPNAITIPLAFLIIGSRQHGMSVLMHEAAHGVLFRNKALNDFAGQYLLAIPYGGDMKSYRRYHLRHHKYAQRENDPDIGLSSKFPVSKASLRRKFIRDITGQTYLRLRLAQMQPEKMDAISGSDAFQKASPWPSLIVNVLMFGILAAAGVWWAYFVLWLLPLVTWFYAVIRLRNIAEHAMTTNDDNPLTHARTTRASWLARVFFAPYYVNYHVEHHAYMYVPCFNLPKLHKRLIALGHGEEMETKSNYRAVLRAASVA
jgi:fatty acid desaturase